MRKILEVLECSNGELKFNTDVNVVENPEEIINITGRAIFDMATGLWGGNEHSVIAMIRAMFLADMALSPNRELLTKQLCREAKEMFQIFEGEIKKMAAQGKAMSFPPGAGPNMKGRRN
jgi:hypothetical protein